MFKIITILLAFYFTSSLYSKDECSLNLKFSGIKNTTGKILIGVFNKTHKDFPDDKYIFKKFESKITSKDMEYKIASIPCGKYSIAVIHDENSNKKLDKNMIGIPKEGFGFSNNPGASAGPPAYENAEFTLPKDTNEMEITLQYLMD